MAALAGLGCRPGDAWMEALYGRVGELVGVPGGLTGPQAASILASLCKLNCRPSRDWLVAVLVGTRRSLSDASTQQLTDLLTSLARLRFRPPEPWMQQFFSASFQRLPFFSPQQCCAAAAAIARLGRKPQGLWLEEFGRQVGQRLALMPGGQQAEAVASLLELGYAPSEAWLAAYEQHSNAQLAGCSAAQLCKALAALSKARFKPQALVVAPSQELAMQIMRVAKSLLPPAWSARGAVQQVIGGANPKRQAEALAGVPGPLLVVGTPGRQAIRLRERGSPAGSRPWHGPPARPPHTPPEEIWSKIVSSLSYSSLPEFRAACTLARELVDASSDGWEALLALEVVRPSPIQAPLANPKRAAALPAILSGANCAVQSYTGSGKTLSYLLPVLTLALRRAEAAEMDPSTPRRGGYPDIPIQ
ncbi:DEAD-box ATP-dependent RNA helicase 47, mitochondrial, partial [Tetrabaena socialis]